MVPGSTFRYGSNFCRVTVNPRLSSSLPIEAAAKPLPSEDTTPPVMKMYFVSMSSRLLGTRLLHQGLNALKISRGLHAQRRTNGRHQPDAVAGLEGTKLLEALELLQHAAIHP